MTHPDLPMVMPTARTQALRLGDFPTLWEALSYAAASGTGVNFFDGRGQLSASLSWGEIAEQAEALAGAFAALAERGAIGAEDPLVAAEQFTWLIVAAPLNRMTLDAGTHPYTEDELDLIADEAVATFLAR